MTCLRIDPTHGANHLGGKQDVFDRNDVEKQVDSRLMVNTSIEIHIVHHRFRKRGQLQHVRQSPETTPVIRNRAAAVRDDELQIGEIREDVRLHQLHECSRIGAQIVRTRRLEIRRVACPADMNHAGDLELAHLFVKRIPISITEGRPCEKTPGRVRIHVASDEAELVYRPFELTNGRVYRSAGRLR